MLDSDKAMDEFRNHAQIGPVTCDHMGVEFVLKHHGLIGQNEYPFQGKFMDIDEHDPLAQSVGGYGHYGNVCIHGVRFIHKRESDPNALARSLESELDTDRMVLISMPSGNSCCHTRIIVGKGRNKARDPDSSRFISITKQFDVQARSNFKASTLTTSIEMKPSCITIKDLDDVKPDVLYYEVLNCPGDCASCPHFNQELKFAEPDISKAAAKVDQLIREPCS